MRGLTSAQRAVLEKCIGQCHALGNVDPPTMAEAAEFRPLIARGLLGNKQWCQACNGWHVYTTSSGHDALTADAAARGFISC